MKSLIENYFLPLLLVNCLALMLAARATAQPYTFGPEVQTTNTANLTYDSGTGIFQYTDNVGTPNGTDDIASLPLSGAAGAFITSTNGWTASITINISGSTMIPVRGNSPHVSMGLSLAPNSFSPSNTSVGIFLSQEVKNGDNYLYPAGFNGTALDFIARTNGQYDFTMTLGSNESLKDGVSFLSLSGGTNTASPEFDAVTGVLTLSYNAATAMVTGYYNGNPVGSYSLSGWGSNLSLDLTVFASSTEIFSVSVGTVTASSFSVNPLQYTFGPEVQSTNSASMTYNPATATFQYTDPNTSSDDHAYLPLTGTAAAFITASNGWTTSIDVNLSPRSMPEFASVATGLLIANSTNNQDFLFILLAQDNNTGGGDDAIYPDGWYGTAARFGANLNGVADVTTPLGGSLASSNGSVYLPLSGGMSASPATESFTNVTGFLTLNYDASVSAVTGYYNGTPIGAYSLAGWGSNPPLTLSVWGGSGEGVAVSESTDNGNGFYAGPLSIQGITQLTFVTNNGTIAITEYTGPGGLVTIPSVIDGLPVTSIGTSAFTGSGVTSVVLPDSVTTIGNGAFYESSLASVIIPNSVTNIGNVVFSDTDLTRIILPTNLANLPHASFQDCASLTNVIISDSVTNIGDEAFQGCGELTSVTVGKGITSIGADAFSICKSLSSLTFPSGVTNIGDGAFGGCTGLTNILFEGNVPIISTPVLAGTPATVYYLPGTTGWGPTFGGAPTALWPFPLPYPAVLNNSTTLGVQSNAFGFTIWWETNRSVVVEASADLAHPVWTPVATNALNGNSVYFSDPQWTNYPSRFYRIRSP